VVVEDVAAATAAAAVLTNLAAVAAAAAGAALLAHLPSFACGVVIEGVAAHAHPANGSTRNLHVYKNTQPMHLMVVYTTYA
jgi:hypothetical protein